MGSQTATQIPVIDLTGENSKPGSSYWVSAYKKIRQALEQHGFFVAEYDKLPLELHDNILSDVAELFELPYETKIQNTSDKPAHGYIGKIAAIPLHEGMGIDRATHLEECEKFTKLMWPSGNDRFCGNAHNYSKLMAELEQMVVRMVFESYGNHVLGLELRTADGNWVGFRPSPTSFVILAGDACMAWSNDRVKPCYHRVIMKGKEARYALGFFSFQRNKLIEPPKELVNEDHPLQYKPFDHMGLLQFYDSVDVRKRAEHTMTKAYCGVST
ncbi:2-oxoglutarate-dependent dioxygenase AOP3-like isoform X2 [Punica granatum]|uniref:2-oxoglutarate-dependent dioxygenase AOP3-like isoform X2 n=1 Tax=Punica granatum TaxID=22663 RepID=A0A6P8CP74_PUNGR|nr:2-oxoglutarate-dependent dioxygenase AOP3-like isoform X2 [Punica granatum]